MNRRTFLSRLGSGALGAAAHTLDLDRLLWVPGKKTIFLPPLVDTETGIAMRFVSDWKWERITAIRFHPDAIAYVMAPLALRDDLSNAYGIAFQKTMSRAEAERRYPGIIFPAGRPTGEARGS